MAWCVYTVPADIYDIFLHADDLIIVDFPREECGGWEFSLEFS